MRSVIWITWENQVRNRTLSARLGAELHVLLSKRGRLWRYAVCTARSFRLIWRQRPAVVLAQNPSIVLTALLILLKYVFRYTFVSDAHYVGIVAASGNRFLQETLDLCNRLADYVIVTNGGHCQYVNGLGGRALVCEDPLPEISKHAEHIDEIEKKVFFICSFHRDEPYGVTFEAAELLAKEEYTVWVSGDFRKVEIDPAQWPNVRFLGYVPESEYYRHLAESQVIVDLTNNENCLVCGGYEAMALEKPLVTSNTAALREYFTGGTIYVDHNARSIAEGVRRAYMERADLKRAVQVWKIGAVKDNDTKINEIIRLLKLEKPVSGAGRQAWESK